MVSSSKSDARLMPTSLAPRRPALPEASTVELPTVISPSTGAGRSSGLQASGCRRFLLSTASQSPGDQCLCWWRSFLLTAAG
jgi:hypothetical protein